MTDMAAELGRLTDLIEGHFQGDDAWQQQINDKLEGLRTDCSQLRKDLDVHIARYDEHQISWREHFGRNGRHPGPAKVELNGAFRVVVGVSMAVAGIFWAMLEVVKAIWPWLRRVGE